MHKVKLRKWIKNCNWSESRIKNNKKQKWRPVGSVQFSCSVISDCLGPHESQHARPPCPSPTSEVYSNSCLSSQWCHPAISSSVIPFSSCPNPSQLLGSYNRKKESQMAVTKTVKRNAMELEQRKIPGSDWGPQVKQTALLASPIYIGAGGKKHAKRGAKIEPGASLLFASLGSAHLHVLRMYFSFACQ